MKQIILIAALSIGLIACDNKGSTKSTQDRARAEEEANTQVENQSQAAKAQQMEKDLADRHFFYGALEGEYEGNLRVDGEKYRVKFVLTRSLPPYSGERVRQLSEIENDINNLFFHMQVVQWHPSDPSTAVGCRVSGIRPNMDQGVLTIASPDCPNLYTVLLSEGGSNAFTQKIEKAEVVADKVRNRVISEVPTLIGSVQPSSNASRYTFQADKLN
jgi:hypothetical protein